MADRSRPVPAIGPKVTAALTVTRRVKYALGAGPPLKHKNAG